ncbi:MAG: GntR family transcriptional regulator [Bauldia sp.]|nr:GntR family transcriptional regulator [Bauldia sp.]
MSSIARAPVRKGLVHKTIASAVASELRKRILAGELPAKTQLRQDMLAEEFDVSRIPVREALMQLEAEGLVRIHAHRGAVVAPLSLEEVAEIFELRALLEPRLLCDSAPRLTAEDYAELHDLGPEYEELRGSGDVAGCAELNKAFHLGLYRHTDMQRTFAFVAKLLQDSDRHTRLQLSYDFNLDHSVAHHAQILDLCEASRFDEASKVMRVHIETAADALRRSIANMAK